MNPTSETAAQSYTLNCRMAQEAAAIERLCQVVRIRGFRIASMAVETAGDHFEITLTLEGSRPVAMLQSQLEKLQTVVEVAVKQPLEEFARHSA
ncbi:MAG: ACT domain-containing protein [Pseudomonadota bacterium]